MENIATDYTGSRDPEYQAVIIVEYDDGRLFPLTETIPRCLLPVANKPLIAYQLDMLAKSNIAETYIVIPGDYKGYFDRFLADYLRDRMTIDLVLVEEMMGSADGLRAVADRIRGDFFCLSSDFISQFSLSELANLHRTTCADISMTISQISKEGSKDDIDLEYFGLTDEGRILMKTPALEIDGHISLSKALIQKAGPFRFRKDLSDVNIYLLSYWLLEFVMTNKKISSIRNELIPYLIVRQYQPLDYLVEHIPAIEHRKRHLQRLEAWLGGNKASTIFQAEENGDNLRVYGLVYEIYNPMNTTTAAAPATGTNATAPAPILLQRVTTIASYLALNKDVPLINYTPRTPWNRVQNYMKKEQSVVGEGTDVSDKSITVKQCTIGAQVKIGAKSKLNNCIVMDYAVIGENCTIQNSIICDRVTIENNCNLNECNVGSGYKVSSGAKVRGESYTGSSSMN